MFFFLFWRGPQGCKRYTIALHFLLRFARCRYLAYVMCFNAWRWHCCLPVIIRLYWLTVTKIWCCSTCVSAWEQSCIFYDIVELWWRTQGYWWFVFFLSLFKLWMGQTLTMLPNSSKWGILINLFQLPQPYSLLSVFHGWIATPGE